jgi:hypothetical protein
MGMPELIITLVIASLLITLSVAAGDGRLQPLDSDYDLYGMAADGDSKSPPSAKAGRNYDVRANDGAFVWLGEDN